MTRQEAIAVLESDAEYMYSQDSPYNREAYRMAVEALEAEPRWIPIEQDCPEKGKDVLISHNGVVSIDWLTQSEGIGYFFVSGVAVQDIDAWMPLPEPYREVEE